MRRPLSALRSPLSAFWICGVIVLAFLAWPRTLLRRRRGPRLLSKRETLAEKYERISGRSLTWEEMAEIGNALGERMPEFRRQRPPIDGDARDQTFDEPTKGRAA